MLLLLLIELVPLAKLNVEEIGDDRSDSTPSSSDEEFETSLENAGHFRFNAAVRFINCVVDASSSITCGIVTGCSD